MLGNRYHSHMEDKIMQNISRENADIIGEVANICIGNAATTLSMILQKPTNITTPIVEVLKKEDALDHDDRILIKVPYTKGLDGTNLLIIKLNDVMSKDPTMKSRRSLLCVIRILINAGSFNMDSMMNFQMLKKQNPFGK